LLIPSRSDGNTRLYTQDDLDQLETILNLTREMGVNLAGIDIIMNMRRRMRQMQEEMQAFVDYVQKEFVGHTVQPGEGVQNAMVRISPAQQMMRVTKRKGQG
jgi:MerR family transcriptional regulator, heat shock protein HspR